MNDSSKVQADDFIDLEEKKFGVLEMLQEGKGCAIYEAVDMCVLVKVIEVLEDGALVEITEPLKRPPNFWKGSTQRLLDTGDQFTVGWEAWNDGELIQVA